MTYPIPLAAHDPRLRHIAVRPTRYPSTIHRPRIRHTAAVARRTTPPRRPTNPPFRPVYHIRSHRNITSRKRTITRQWAPTNPCCVSPMGTRLPQQPSTLVDSIEIARTSHRAAIHKPGRSTSNVQSRAHAGRRVGRYPTKSMLRVLRFVRRGKRRRSRIRPRVASSEFGRMGRGCGRGHCNACQTGVETGQSCRATRSDARMFRRCTLAATSDLDGDVFLPWRE